MSHLKTSGSLLEFREEVCKQPLLGINVFHASIINKALPLLLGDRRGNGKTLGYNP